MEFELIFVCFVRECFNFILLCVAVQKEIKQKIMSRAIIHNDNESGIFLKLPLNRSPRPDGFTCEFYQIFGEQVTPSLLKLWGKVAEKGKAYSFYEASIILIPKADKNTTKREHYRRISSMNPNAKKKILSKMLASKIQ